LIDKLSLNLASGQSLFLSGPSGCGKSTLLSLASGILSPTSGKVYLSGYDLSLLSGSKRDRLRGDLVGFVFQEFNLLPYLSVIENVLLPMRFSSRKRTEALKEYPSEKEAAIDLLGRLGLGRELIFRPAVKLSVGQRQRVAAARALLGRPSLVLADEPTSALDADLRLSFLNLFLDECHKAGAALIFVSHDRELASRFPISLPFDSLGPGLWPQP
jgi:putative ABC transport system ATP-binding protein